MWLNIFLANFFIIGILGVIENQLYKYNVTRKSFVFWPNGTIPFYIDTNHFDSEQSHTIMVSLAMLSYKTCLKFYPLLAPPTGNKHALVFENPGGVRKCVVDTEGHPRDRPHKLQMGYSCLESPKIDMMIMKALGFTFEHNRASRDIYVNVQIQNVDPSFVVLFTKENLLPPELRSLPYDINSVMHFGERDYSKNGHRTIIFKNHAVTQNRVGLSPTDLRKIEVVYGPECRKRDRQEKIEMCQKYPGVARRKRDIEPPVDKSLRINPDITPPTDVAAKENDVDLILKDLGIEVQVQEVVDHVYKVSALALKNARLKYCNKTNTDVLRSGFAADTKDNDILGVIEIVANYAQTIVNNAMQNLTEFCRDSDTVEAYMRAGCNWGQGDRCPKYFKSTKSGAVRYSTQHRPIIPQSTKHEGKGRQIMYARAGDEADVNQRRKREAEDETKSRKKRDGVEKDNGTVASVEPEILRTATKMYSKRRNERSFQEHRYSVKHKRRSEESDSEMSIEVKKTKQEKSKEDSEEKVETPKRVEKREKKRKRQKIVPNVEEEVVKEKKHKNLKETSYRELKNLEEKPHRELKEPRHKKHKVKDEINEKPVVSTEPRFKKRKHKERSGKPVISHKDTPKPKTVRLSKLSEEFYSERRWPGGIVPYILSDDYENDKEDVRRRLEEVNAILLESTCVKLLEIEEKDAVKYEDYLVLDGSADFVTGRVGGKQNFGCLELFQGGQHRQYPAMIAMAMLGFYFEVSRHDRDKYVRVHMRHVRPDKLHHFEKIREEATFPLPYDYESATHPAWQFWRKIGKIGISTVATFKQQDPDGSVMKSFGQHEQLLSNLDIVKINTVYGTKCFGGPELRTEGRTEEHSKVRTEARPERPEEETEEEQ